MGIVGLDAAIFRVDECADVLHGTWTIQRDHRGDVGQRSRLQLLDVSRHARAFQLEHAHGIAPGQQIECVGIVERDVLQSESETSRIFKQASGFRQHRQIHQTQEVHLQ